MPESIAITYGNVDVKVNESFVAIPGRGLTSTCDPDFDAPRYDSYADGVDRRFVTVTSCGEWYENLNIVLELVRTPDGWRVHGAGMHLSTDNMIWLGQDLWLRPLTGSIRIDCDDADGSPRVRSSLRLSADVESPHDRGPCHYAANATFQVAFTPVLPIAPPFVRAYAEAAAKTARR